MFVLPVIDLYIDMLTQDQITGIIQLHIEIIIAAGVVAGTASIRIIIIIVLCSFLCVQASHGAVPGFFIIHSGMNNDRKTFLNGTTVLLIGSSLYTVISGGKNGHKGVAVIAAVISIRRTVSCVLINTLDDAIQL